MESVTDETGENVILTQTGQYLDALGMLTIKADGTIGSTLLSCDDLISITADAEVKSLEDNWIEEINTELGKVIGYTDITFDNYDANGNRLVRKQNTNSGSFAADALYYLFDEMDMDEDEVETECATVGGWATENIGAMPVPFDAFDYLEYTILVMHVDDNHRITRLLILRHHIAEDKHRD